jgi:hypothetical protein
MKDSTRDAETEERFTVLLSALRWPVLYWTGKVRYITDHGYITVPETIINTITFVTKD